MVSELAVMVLVPAVNPFTRPDVLIVATVLALLSQETPVVRFLTLPSSYVPRADIWSVFPCSMFCPDGPTVIVVRTGFTKNPRQPAARASSKSALNAAKTRGLRFTVDIVKRIRDERNCSR
jgi:hypothetical protein